MSRFVRRGRSASGAVTVQVVEKRGSRVISVEHVGSANTDADLAVLLERAERLLHPDQEVLDLGELGRSASMESVADWRQDDAPRSDVESTRTRGRPRSAAGSSGVVVGQPARILWQVLTEAYARLGFDCLDDDVFMKVVLARIVEATSKIDALRVLRNLGVEAPATEKTIYRMLQRVTEGGYRQRLADACFTHASRGGPLTLVMYDATTLHFQAEIDESSLTIEAEPRRVGRSKEHRVDPQVQVGLLVDAGGFPLDVYMFPGNAAETKTLIPVVERFLAAHPAVTDLVVVADAGLLSAANLNALEDHHLHFIVGSRTSRAPYDLAAYFQAHGNNASDGEVIETTRVMGTGKDARERRVVYQYRFARAKREERTLGAQVARAQDIAQGRRPMKKDRFVALSGDRPLVDEKLVERARQALGFKGYVSNIPTTTMTGEQVIAAYHDLYQVERSFRMTKGDLAARPIYLHSEDKIEAHLTTVMAALAIARDLQDRTGLTIRAVLHTLEPLRSSRIRFGEQVVEFPPQTTPQQQKLLTTLGVQHPTGH
ncbi:IS1634 family transposase [Corynebacterium falsenii]|uniref:IS1634 family transposase n=1 Tax=Corynebacterium falsenii TaxID=108486 RepID=A0A418Q6N2_9CORY|nr:IS1634 family transposase [Corynebacterium falsenii]RIX34572.1 IS1634 family transposase [Corynebacterium falsenii]